MKTPSQMLLLHAKIRVPDPHGMSGGGVWRPHYKGSTIWTTENIHFLGILTEYHEDKWTIKANRIENIYHLLSLHFELPTLDTLA